MKFSELITKLHSASQPHMLMYIDIRSDCELADVNILASGQSDVQAGTLYFADAGQLTPDTVLPTNLLYYGTLPPELADRLTNSAMIDRGEFRCSAVFQRLLCNGFNLLCCAKRLEERMVNVSVYFFFLQCYISFQLL